MNMLTFSTHLTILLSIKPIDMRRGIDGLTVLIAEQWVQLEKRSKSEVAFLKHS